MKGATDIGPTVKISLRRCQMSGKTREQVAHEMSENLGQRVTVDMLNDFSRAKDSRRKVRFPLSWLRAFCGATGSDELAIESIPDHLQVALAVGEGVLGTPGTVEQAIAHLKKLQLQRERKETRRVILPHKKSSKSDRSKKTGAGDRGIECR